MKWNKEIDVWLRLPMLWKETSGVALEIYLFQCVKQIPDQNSSVEMCLIQR